MTFLISARDDDEDDESSPPKIPWGLAMAFEAIKDPVERWEHHLFVVYDHP